MARETVNSRVAVLEIQVANIEKKVDNISEEIKEVHACLHKTREMILSKIETLRSEEQAVHKEQDQRIASLENWRWYILGIVCALGVVAKLLFGV